MYSKFMRLIEDTLLYKRLIIFITLYLNFQLCAVYLYTCVFVFTDHISAAWWGEIKLTLRLKFQRVTIK